MTLKNVLITLASLAVLLGIITFYVVFYGSGGTYVVNSPLGSSTGNSSSSTLPVSTSTASSTLGGASSSASSSLSGNSSTIITQSGEAPITWQEGNEMMSVTGAQLSGTQLTLNVQVQMGSVAECVPMNVRLVTDENGDLAAPITSQFAFPDTGTCNGTPGETYGDQEVIFTVANPTAFPFVLTSGGSSNLIFEVTTDPNGNLIVELPPESD